MMSNNLCITVPQLKFPKVCLNEIKYKFFSHIFQNNKKNRRDRLFSQVINQNYGNQDSTLYAIDTKVAKRARTFKKFM